MAGRFPFCGIITRFCKKETVTYMPQNDTDQKENSSDADIIHSKQWQTNTNIPQHNVLDKKF